MKTLPPSLLAGEGSRGRLRPKAIDKIFKWESARPRAGEPTMLSQIGSFASADAAPADFRLKQFLIDGARKKIEPAQIS